MGLRRMLAGLVPAVATLLAGCGDSDGPAVVQNFYRGPIVESLFFSASRKGKVLAEVHGNPFAGGEQELLHTIYGSMADAVAGRVVTFTNDVSAVEQPNNKIVIVFNPPTAMSGYKVCEGKIPDSVPPKEEGRITVRALFCGDGDLLSDAEGWIRRVDRPDDDRFRRLIFDLAYALLLQKS